MTNYNAASGSRDDIQAAVDLADPAAGDNVFIPAGHADWNGEKVTIPAGVNVFGASYAGCNGYPSFTEYDAATILHNNASPPVANEMFYINGGQYASPRLATRISGISFIATAPEDSAHESGSVAIVGQWCENLRVDHCSFKDFANISVLLKNTHDGSASGIIDHCVINNPYKLDANGWLWAYGFYVQGNATYWDDTSAPLTDFLGAFPVPDDFPVLYVEDCKMSYCRHAVDAIQGGWIVARYCYVDHPYPTNFGQLQVHGSGGDSWPSARGFEFYNNTVVGEAAADHAEPVWLRGGAGVVYNNSFTNVKGGGYGIGLFRELCTETDEILHDVWIWVNTLDAGTLINNSGGFIEDTDYFLRAPTFEDDGFIYTPLDYPHPLIGEENGGTPPESRPGPQHKFTQQAILGLGSRKLGRGMIL